jgi:hypothetical protein
MRPLQWPKKAKTEYPSPEGKASTDGCLTHDHQVCIEIRLRAAFFFWGQTSQRRKDKTMKASTLISLLCARTELADQLVGGTIASVRYHLSN